MNRKARKEFEKFKEEMTKLVEVTQFEIRTEGPDTVYISLKGCTQGVVYKLALTILEFVKMGVLDADDINEIGRLVNMRYGDSVKEQAKFQKHRHKQIRREEATHCRMAEIRGDLAEELLEELNKVRRGEISEDEIDFEYFMRRAKEEEDED